MSSMKNRHWPVTIALLGSPLLETAIVISTSLFAPRFSDPAIDTRIEMAEQFHFDTLDAIKIDITTASLYTSLLLKQVAFPAGTNAVSVAERFHSHLSAPCK
jgi:hypothetical protein